MKVHPDFADFVLELDGLSGDEILESKTQGKLGDQIVWYLGREAFVKNKRSAGRHKDLADLELLGEETDR